MSGKFMKVKKVVIPTITLVLIASQLMGCAAASQNELLSMIDAGQSVEIEVAAPAFAEAEQGEENSLIWEQLALLTTNPELRSSWDDILGITKTDTGKNGMLYVDVDGKNENNNTLRVALHNREFQKAIENDSTVKKLVEATEKNYADLVDEDSTKSLMMGINSYFNILPDSTPNYCNADSTVTRAEFLAAVFRAETPVSDVYAATKSFIDSVGLSDYNDSAYVTAENSYLKTSNKSLNNQTYNGTISRGEAIYLLVDRYFKDDLKSVDTSKVTLIDAKDGGDIATKQGFAGKDYSTAYTIVYCLQNPDSGVPTDMYKALVVAKNKGLISDETRWDEGLTRSEAIELIVSAYEKETGIATFNAKQGTTPTTEETYQEQLDNLAKEIETATEDKEPETIAPEDIIDESYVEVEEDTGASQAAFTVTPMTATLYAVKNCNIRKGPDSKAYEIIGTLNSGDAVEVTGKVDGLNWYEISLAGGKAYVSASLLQSTQPSAQPAPSTPAQSSSSSSTATPSTPSQSSTPSTPSSTEDNPVVWQEGELTRYANGDTLYNGVIYKQGEFIPNHGIYGGHMR